MKKRRHQSKQPDQTAPPNGWPSVWMTKGPYPDKPQPAPLRPFPPRIDIPPDVFMHCDVTKDIT